jgi:3-oxoadipate enol-lactonase
MWDPQRAALGERFDVITYDMRGHGATPAPPGPYEIADLAGDVLALLDERGVERAHFCGLSIGGMIGQWLGAHAPQRIDRLVLCCTSPHAPPAEAWRERAQTVRAAGSTEPIADAVVGRWLTPAYAEAHPDVRARLRAMLTGCDPEGYAGCCAAIERMDLRPDLAGITAPTLVIGAADDPSLPVDPHTDAVAAGIPGARREIVAGAHLANVENADAVTALIIDHLEAT